MKSAFYVKHGEAWCTFCHKVLAWRKPVCWCIEAQVFGKRTSKRWRKAEKILDKMLAGTYKPEKYYPKVAVPFLVPDGDVK